MTTDLLALHPMSLLALAGMAVGTYLTRISGFLLLGHLRPQGRFGAALDALPGAVLIALVAPQVAAGGMLMWAASAVTVVAARRLPTLLAILAGVATLLLLRWVVA